MMRKLFSLRVGLLLLIAATGLAQKSGPKNYFDKSGKACPEDISYYYRQESDTSGYFYSYYTINDHRYFSGRIKNANPEDESRNIYTGACTWYYKNGNPKQTLDFDANGKEKGVSRYYYESGKIWKEIEYEKGKIKNNTFNEYNEDGSRNRIFEEEFLNNNNEWDLYASDKSTASISDGVFELQSFSKEGTSRYINHVVESPEYAFEAVINIAASKDADRVGIIYGFKDWQNYYYFAISKKNVYIGSFYEGVKSVEIDGMFCSVINPTGNNTIKILCTGEKVYFSVNGEIQYKDNATRLLGNNTGFVLSGNAKVKIDKFTIKEMNVGTITPADVAPSDRDVKATGSGLLFSTGGYILTNHHVIDNAKKIMVELNTNGTRQNLNAEVVIADKDNDLAIIKIKDDAFRAPDAIKYSFKENGQIEVGSTAFTIGYPHALSGMGKEAKFNDGKISSKTGYNGSINSFQTSIPVQPGNSGGPVFNESGQLIGLINARFENGDNVSYGIKLNYIKNLIELMPENVETPSSNNIAALSLEEKLKVLTNYVVLIKIK